MDNTLINYNWLNDDNDQIIYVGDPLCSWCYGIAPELKKLQQQNAQLPFRVINGGLRPYNTEHITALADMLKQHWQEVEERSGQPFSYAILQNDQFIYDTEPPARAVTVARIMNPSIEFDFFHAVQKAFYAENKDTADIHTYLTLCIDFELDTNQFETLFNDSKVKEATKADFQITQQLGISGFPAVIYKKGKQLNLVANGYTSADLMKERMDSVR